MKKCIQVIPNDEIPASPERAYYVRSEILKKPKAKS
jgi:hypothetical protein